MCSMRAIRFCSLFMQSKDPRSVASVVYNPIMNELFTATEGGGVQLFFRCWGILSVSFSVRSINVFAFGFWWRVSRCGLTSVNWFMSLLSLFFFFFFCSLFNPFSCNKRHVFRYRRDFWLPREDGQATCVPEFYFVFPLHVHPTRVVDVVCRVVSANWNVDTLMLFHGQRSVIYTD